MNEKRMKVDAPQHTKDTVVRLCRMLKPQRVRLNVVGISIVIYVILAIYTPFRSAQVVDAIWHGVQTAVSQGTAFSGSGRNRQTDSVAVDSVPVYLDLLLSAGISDGQCC